VRAALVSRWVTTSLFKGGAVDLGFHVVTIESGDNRGAKFLPFPTSVSVVSNLGNQFHTGLGRWCCHQKEELFIATVTLDVLGDFWGAG
jgi:hypothetical protein